jgi:hypothetical protein
MPRPRSIMRTDQPWSEAYIAQAVARQIFTRAELIIPNCYWAGSEMDLLVIESKRMRIIDVEIKISRSDLKADIKKDKWWYSRPWSKRHVPRRRRLWPDKVWKHYYVMPASIWSTELFHTIPETSGIVLLSQQESKTTPIVAKLIRRAQPCREAKPISPHDAVDIARLASLRMWAALTKEST